MSDRDDSDFQSIQRELRQAMHDLGRLEGETPLPDVDGEPPYCSFCGKGKNEYRCIVKGPAIVICDACVREARRMVDESVTADD